MTKAKSAASKATKKTKSATSGKGASKSKPSKPAKPARPAKASKANKPAKASKAPKASAPPKASAAKADTAAKATSKPAASSAGNRDEHAKNLLEIAGEVLPRDQVAPIAALLEAYSLAKEGALSPEVTVAVWRAGTGPTQATSAKARKGQEKLFAAAGFANDRELVIDCATRFVAAGTYDAEDLKSVLWLHIQSLLDLGRVDEAIALFKQWTGEVVEAGRAGKYSYDTDWIETWFGTYIWKIGIDGPKEEHARAIALRDAEKARAS